MQSLSLLTNIDGLLYFSAANLLNGYEPWKSDGTDAGTAMIANLAPDPVPSSFVRNIVAAGDWVYFEAWDGTGRITQDGLPWSLWRSDGTPEGTIKLSDSTRPPYMPAGHSLLFNNGGIWSSDGTPESTGPASELSKHFPGASTLFYASGNIVIAAISGSLWATTTSPGAASVPIGIQQILNVAGRLLFFGGSDIWTTDGTADGTYAIVPDLGEFVESGAVVMGGHVFFSTRSSAIGGKLWKTDGTFEGSVIVKVLPGAVRVLSAAGRNLFFTAGGQLWISDGTEGGTHSLPATPAQGTLAAIGDRVVFAADDAATGIELWTSDGTPEGTHLVSDLYPGTFGSSPSEMTSAGGLVYFTAYHDLFGSEPWVTDGTAAGTKLVADIEPGLTGSLPQNYVQAGDRLFFNATTLATGSELWALSLPLPPRLTINDIRVAEGDSGTTTARFTVTLSPASSKAVKVDYATADGTATAGSDYTATSGTLTFAAGETSKSIDVSVRGDTNPENNETFFVMLRNATGATLPKSSAFAIIDDDDQFADVGLGLNFSILKSHTVSADATNDGPRTATNFRLSSTVTPASGPQVSCSCSSPVQLAPGTKATAFNFGVALDQQQYFTASISARQRDTQPANNSAGWTTHDSMAMDALFLTPGSQANVWFSTYLTPSSFFIDSSNPAVLSVPASLTVSSSGSAVSFVVRALSAGTAVIHVFTSTSVVSTLTVDVVAPGTNPRWPSQLSVSADHSPVTFDKQVTLTITSFGTAPFTGQTTTGLVTVTANGKELGRFTLTPAARTFTVPYYAPAIGSNPVTVTYAGDANFLAATSTTSVVATLGSVTLLAGAARTGTTVTIHVRANGSPLATPSGTISISETGAFIASQVPLVAVSAGVADAEVTLTNVAAAPHTYLVFYSGDGKYNGSLTSARINDARHRAVPHQEFDTPHSRLYTSQLQ